MWRLILVTFAFLAFAFYELSGGADYAPREDSLQVAMRGKSIFATPKQIAPQTDDVRLAAADRDLVDSLKSKRRAAIEAAKAEREARKRERYARAVALQDANLFDATLAAVQPGEIGDEDVTRAAYSPEELRQMGMSGVGSFSADSLVQDTDIAGQGGFQENSADALFNAALAVQPDAAERPAMASGNDLRTVTGNLVNMRGGPGTDFGRVDQLSEGTRVEVLDSDGSGWLRLRVVETGQVGWMADWLVTPAAF